VREVAVRRKPIVAVLSTGDELCDVSRPLSSAQVFDSNRPMLLSLLAPYASRLIDLGIASDGKEPLAERFERALAEADVLVTSGGVSMGEKDHVKPLLERIGEVHFGRVLMKPGKPLTFATVPHLARKRLVFGLPGNPVSSLVTSTLAVIPALKALAGLNPE
jgi:gephyrin